jgi:hypothetical protein
MKLYASLAIVGALLLALAPVQTYAAIDNLDIGGDIRTLGVYTDNVVDLNDGPDDQNDFLRLEAHIWFEATLADNVKAKVSFEVDRDWDSNAGIEGEESGSNSTFSSNGDLNVFLEEAWIKVAYIYDSPLSLTLGRQFIQFGDGFIIGDSQPNTPQNLTNLGDWEQDPFDAIDANLDWDTFVLDLVWAKSVEEHEADGDGDLAGLNLDFSGIEGHVLSFAYWFLRTEDAQYARYDKVYYADREDLHVLDVRATGELFIPGLTYVGEFAYQFGSVDHVIADYRSDDISAFAGHAGLMYRPEMELSPFFGFDYYYLSGGDGVDNEGNIDDENEWRQVFENHTYGEIAENWVMSNMNIFNVSLGLDNIADGKWAVALKYYYFLMDNEEGSTGEASLPTAGPNYGYYDKVASSGGSYPYADYPYLSGEDDDFGHEIDMFVTYNFSESLVAKVAGGVFIPGDAIEVYEYDYDEDGSYGDADNAYFVRGEVAVKF